MAPSNIKPPAPPRAAPAKAPAAPPLPLPPVWPAPDTKHYAIPGPAGKPQTGPAAAVAWREEWARRAHDLSDAVDVAESALNHPDLAPTIRNHVTWLRDHLANQQAEAEHFADNYPPGYSFGSPMMSAQAAILPEPDTRKQAMDYVNAKAAKLNYPRKGSEN